MAEPGTTYVSDDTFKLTEGFFRFEALGEKEIKGKEKPLRVYQVIAPSTRRTRFDVSAERGLTPLVGRERELELLLDGFERSKEGRGQAISIISDAGIGKSRLLYEFRKAVTNEYVTFLEGRCLSYSRNVAYHPVVDILKANFDIQDNDTDEEIREKVITGLKILKVDEASTLALSAGTPFCQRQRHRQNPHEPGGQKGQNPGSPKKNRPQGIRNPAPHHGHRRPPLDGQELRGCS